MKIRENFLVTKMGLNVKAISEIVSIFKNSHRMCLMRMKEVISC